MRVVFSARGRADLRDIAAYIAKDSPQRARTYVAELRVRSMQLVQTPQGFPLVPGYEAYGVRRCPFQNYLIFYMLRDEQIFILAILHAARDYARLLFPEG